MIALRRSIWKHGDATVVPRSTTSSLQMRSLAVQAEFISVFGRAESGAEDALDNGAGT